MMTPAERAEFQEVRSRGLGGSDCASLLADVIKVQYGCKRRLGLQKARVEPDFEREETGPMRLGQILEPYLCDDFAKATGRRVEVVGRQVHPEYPELGGHTDRMQRAPEYEGIGVVEAKALGTRVFYTVKREGISTDYELQLAFYLAVTDARYGSFVCGNRDNLALLYWDVQRNDDLCDAIVRKGVEFWRGVGNLDALAPVLESDDARCQRCEYRLRCHGSTLLPASASDKEDIPVAPELSALAVEYITRNQLLKQAEDLVDETKEILMAELGERTAVQIPVNGVLRPLYWRPQEGKPLYAECVKSMSVQYNVMRDRLIQIEKAVRDPNARNVDADVIALTEGSELIPPPSSFIKKGKPSRPLMAQYLEQKPRKEKDA